MHTAYICADCRQNYNWLWDSTAILLSPLYYYPRLLGYAFYITQQIVDINDSIDFLNIQMALIIILIEKQIFF